MTWVVGGRHVGCVRCIADVEVTISYADGTKKPGGFVKKVHQLSDDLAISFADNIRLAFAIIDAIKSEFMPRFDKRLLDEPELIAERLARFIKYAFKKNKRGSGENVEFLIFVRPKKELASYGLWKLVSPEFKRVAPPSDQPFQMLEIGSGSVATVYRDLIKRGSKGFIEIPGENGEKPTAIIPLGKVGMQWLFAEAIEHQVAGISRDMHLMMMYSGGVILAERPSDPDGAFPRVAENWLELRDSLRKKGIRLTAGYAVA